MSGHQEQEEWTGSSQLGDFNWCSFIFNYNAEFTVVSKSDKNERIYGIYG